MAKTTGETTKNEKNWRQQVDRWKWGFWVLAVISTATTIGWLNSYPPMATDWSVIANVSTAIGTIGLAVFAVLAWRSSKSSLKTMRKQIKSQSKDTSRQIRHSRQLARKARQTETLATLIVSMNRVRAAILREPESVLSIVTEMETTSKIWQMQSRTQSKSIRLSDASFSLLAEIVRRERGPVEKLSGEEQHSRFELERAVRDLTQSLYQGNKRAFHEEKAEAELLRVLNAIIKAYPDLGARVQPDGSVGFWRILSDGGADGVEISERQSFPGNDPLDGVRF